MLKQLKNNDGVVFVTVLAITITLMVLAVSIISMNVSQTMVSEKEVKRVKGEILATGALTYFYANQLSNSPGDTITLTETLDNIDYSITISHDPGGAGPTAESESKPLSVQVDF